MIKIISIYCLLSIWNICVAEDLIITNAHIIDGTGKSIPQGSIIINDGKITAVSIGKSTASGDLVIDAQGMSVMPGFIDGHRHIIDSDINSDAAVKQWFDEQAADNMLSFLDAGFTTVLSAGDNTAAIIELRQRLASGKILGPRLQVSGSQIRPPNPGEWEKCMADAFCKANSSLVRDDKEARIKAREFLEAGVDTLKVRFNRKNPNGLAKSMIETIIDEAKKYNIPVIVMPLKCRT